MRDVAVFTLNQKGDPCSAVIPTHFNSHSTPRCGYATLHHVVDKSKEDRMESFFLSETCKYLYLVCTVGSAWSLGSDVGPLSSVKGSPLSNEIKTCLLSPAAVR